MLVWMVTVLHWLVVEGAVLHPVSKPAQRSKTIAIGFGSFMLSPSYLVFRPARFALENGARLLASQEEA
jgi:hypothetical protein